MYFILEPHQQQAYPHLIEQMFRLRKKVFSDELRWVETYGPEERDEYDDMNPIYVMHTDPTGRHLYSCGRQMPMSGPTLLSDVFADTVPDVAALTSPSVWEITRFCVDNDLIRAHGRGTERVQILRKMNAVSLELGVRIGIEAYVANFDNLRLRMWRRIGKPFDVLGTSNKYGIDVHLGISECSQAVLEETWAELGVDEPIMTALPAPLPVVEAAGEELLRAA